MADSIVVVQTAFLGDVVLTTPLFRALRRCRPEAHIAALVTPEAAPLIEEDPHLDRVLTYDKKGGQSLASVVGAVRRLRPDVVISPHRSQRSALVALASGARTRVGFADTGFRWVYNRRVVRPPGQHEVDRNLSLLAGLDATPVAADRELHVGFTEQERAAVESAMAGVGLDPLRPLVVLFPGSVWETKRWPAAGFSRVARSLVAQGCAVAVLGGPKDRAVAAQVAADSGAADLAGRTSLKALAAWMDRASLAVTNDSAPLHVAAARRTPTVAVFGATTLGLGFGPFHPEARVVQADLACRPCGPHGGRRCPQGHFHCMGEVSPEQVLDACRSLLEARP